MDHQKHKPVLAREVLELLNPQPKDSYLDLTAGFGGHAKNVADLVGSDGSLALVDRDASAIKHLKKIFKDFSNVEFFNRDFLSASKKLAEDSRLFDVILADLGVSSQHFDDPSRGFSFHSEAPLDMRMDTRQQATAADIVNMASEKQLAEILAEYGEIKAAHKLAKKIVQYRPYSSAKGLADRIASFQMKRKSRIHPATLVFQALRIAVNDELNQLEESLPIWIGLLNTGGRLGVISFHSLEDRLVKQAFANYGGKRYDATLQTVTKKPVTASTDEIVFNPRARSALLRVAQRK